MATTVPDNIWTPDYTTPYNLPVDLAAMADTVQAALNAVRSERAGLNQQFYGPAAGRTALTGVEPGDTYQESDGDKKRWMRSAAGTWKLWDAPAKDVTQFGTAWGPATSVGNKPRVFVRAGIGYIQGAFRSAATGTPADSSMATLPDLDYAPKYWPGGVPSAAATSGTGSTMFMSFSLTSSGEFWVNARSGPTPNSVDFPINMHWIIDLD